MHRFKDIEARKILFVSALSVNAGSVNVMVNDNDGGRRESFISIAPGEERFRKAEFFPNVIFAEE